MRKALLGDKESFTRVILVVLLCTTDFHLFDVLGQDRMRAGRDLFDHVEH